MTLKNVLQPNHAPINKYELLVLGLPSIVFTKVGGIEQETGAVELPDNTTASGGQQKAFEVVCELPLHHVEELDSIESWYKEGKDPITPTYKKVGSMLYKGGDDSVVKSYSLLGAWIKKIKYPDAEMANDGEMGVVEITMSVDDYAVL